MATSFSTRFHLFMPAACGFVSRMTKAVVPGGTGTQPGCLGFSWAPCSGFEGEAKLILYTKLLYVKGHSGLYAIGLIFACWDQNRGNQQMIHCSCRVGWFYFDLKSLWKQTLNEVDSALEIGMIVIHFVVDINQDWAVRLLGDVTFKSSTGWGRSRKAVPLRWSCDLVCNRKRVHYYSKCLM